MNKFAYASGGADIHALELAKLLRARGHAVEWLSTRDPRNEENAGEFISNVVSNATRSELDTLSKVRVAARAIWNREAAARMHALIAAFDPDVVHLHKLYPQLSAAAVLSIPRGVPIVQTIHDHEFVAADPYDDTGGWLDRRDELLSYRVLNTLLFPARRRFHAGRVSAWIAVSDYIAAWHRRRYGIEPVVLPNFVAPSRDRLARPWQAREGVAFAGRLSEEKGVRQLVTLAAALPDQRVLVAGEGPCADELRRTKPPNLQLLGRLDRDQVRALFRSARVVVVPSRCSEAGALTPLEAMAEGTPVVVSDRGALPEYSGEGAAGAVVSSAASLIRESERLIRSEDGWETASGAALRLVAERHSPEKYAESLEGIYVDALHKHGDENAPARSVLGSGHP